MRRYPLGQQVYTTLITQGQDAAAELARDAGQLDLFNRVRSVACEEPIPSFLHSALCAMSLPVRRPVDDHAPIIRQDGQYTLVITPKAVVQSRDGQQVLHTLGVPYGSLPRLILIHIMTEAVRTKSRHIVLGSSFTDWMRRMGFRTISYGPRGSATLIRQQLDRLLACEWMIRWDGDSENGTKEFGVKEIKLTNEYVGSDSKGGSFQREIYLSEDFFTHLSKHAVPLNEHAISQLRESATALDLYTWLAYRLPRINPKRPALLSWQQLASHFGNDGTNIRKFRQTVRDAWERQVSAVYPEARAEFDGIVIRLHASPAPLQHTAIGRPKLTLVSPTIEMADDKSTPDANVPERFFAAITAVVGAADAKAFFRNTQLVCEDGVWRLKAPSRFIADWITGHFSVALDRARQSVELKHTPEVVVAAR